MDNQTIHLEFYPCIPEPCSHIINIPDVFSCRLQCVLRYTWNEYTHSFSKDTSNEYTRSFCRHMNRNKCNAYSHSLTTHEMHIHMYTQCFLRTICDFVSTRVCILVVFYRDDSKRLKSYGSPIIMSKGGNIYHLIWTAFRVNKWTDSEHVPSLRQMADLPSRGPERHSDPKLRQHIKVFEKSTLSSWTHPPVTNRMDVTHLPFQQD